LRDLVESIHVHGLNLVCDGRLMVSSIVAVIHDQGGTVHWDVYNSTIEKFTGLASKNCSSQRTPCGITACYCSVFC